MLMSYRPELDVLEQLDNEKVSWYVSAISVFHWVVELGRINICMEMSLLVVQMAMPRLGHLYAAMGLWVPTEETKRMTGDGPQHAENQLRCFQRQRLDWILW